MKVKTSEKPLYLARNAIALVLSIVVLLVLPFLVPKFYVSLTTEALIMGIMSVSFAFLFKTVGLFSFGQAAFLGIGSYAAAILIERFQIIELSIIVLVAIALSLSYSLFLSYLSFYLTRLGGLYFSILTLTLATLLYEASRKLAITGGFNGMIIWAVPRPFNLDLVDRTAFYYFVLCVTFISIGTFAGLLNSRFGMVLRGVGQCEERLIHLGYDARRYKLAAVVISGAFTAIGGVLLALLNRFASPLSLTYGVSGVIVFGAILGGVGSLVGPVIGSFVWTYSKSIMAGYMEVQLIPLGLTLILLMLFLPDGIMGGASHLRKLRGKLRL